MIRLFISNLPYNATEDDVCELFANFGYRLDNFKILLDRDTGRSRGFGFGDCEAQCMEDINGQDLDGRKITVKEAEERKPRESSPRGGRR